MRHSTARITELVKALQYVGDFSVQLEHDPTWAQETVLEHGGDVTIIQSDGNVLVHLPAYQSAAKWKPGPEWHPEGKPYEIVARVQEQLLHSDNSGCN